uniref:Helicase ATP-binding domain-containing protein n=1 Tax=viral metagenome TaxID=1070528 RepID=A0A6C0KIG2_9ZZZZ
MDFVQTKLRKNEWEQLEIPILQEERNIIQLIRNGYYNNDVCIHKTVSLFSFIKLYADTDVEKIHTHLFHRYFYDDLKVLIMKKQLPIEINNKKNIVLSKKATLIRLNNLSTKIKENTPKIFEFIIMELCKKYITTEKTEYYYALYHLIYNNLSYKIEYLNPLVINILREILNCYIEKIDKTDIVYNAKDYIENNSYIKNNEPISLFSHQKNLFQILRKNRANPKLILYQAPTGTGKTLSPLAICQDYKVIFVCAAKHVGLQLAKNCISMNIPIGIAFGCKDAGDVKLHNFAAKEYIRNYKSGGIFKVDHSIGDKVQVIISDVKSYESAMNYMCAFNKPKDIVLFWDEPTISLDYKEHDFHPIINKNWRENRIPNVILSSATLPFLSDLNKLTDSFKSRFPNAIIKSINSHIFNRTISIIDKEGYVILPHNYYNDYADVKNCIKHINAKQQLLCYFDIRGISLFLQQIHSNKLIPNKKWNIDNYFKNISQINIENIKLYYIFLLERLEEQWNDICKLVKENREKRYASTIYITSKDASTITHGPCLFLSNNVEKIADFYIQSSNIREKELDTIQSKIQHNDKINHHIAKLKKQLTQENDTTSDREKLKLIEKYELQLQKITLNERYIPNSYNHIQHYHCNKRLKYCFASDINEQITEKIVLLPIHEKWKILLLMGIGVFMENHLPEYRDIIKQLAYEEKLFCIIANSDYIYGTNYQFCHGYLSKDLNDLTQEKLIQALGRIGRQNKIGDYTIRLRDNSLIELLLQEKKNSLEIYHMNHLFNYEEYVYQ